MSAAPLRQPGPPSSVQRERRLARAARHMNELTYVGSPLGSCGRPAPGSCTDWPFNVSTTARKRIVRRMSGSMHKIRIGDQQLTEQHICLATRPPPGL